MSTKTTLLLLALAGVLLAFIALYEVKQPKSWEAADREKYVLLFDRNAVEGIDITSNEDKVEFRRHGNRWMLEAPVKDRADLKSLNELLSLCESLQKEPVAGCAKADKNQMKAFGVINSSVRLKLLGKDMPKELLFGKETAVEGKVYVRLEGSKTISVASNELRNLIVRSPDELRDHQLADFEFPSVSHFSVKTAAGEIELTKKKDRWDVVKPLRARASDAVVNAFLDSVLHTRIEAFLPENSANLNSYGLSEPRGVVTFWNSTEQPAVLEIGARDEKTGGVYARFTNRSSISLLPKASENILGLRPNDLRDRRLMHVDLDIVDRITLRPAGKAPVVLQRKLEEWLIRSNGPTDASLPANKAKIMQLVKELQTRKIAAFVTDVASDLAKYGFDQPQLRITFSSYASENTAETNAGEQPLFTLAFGKTDGDVVYARVEDEPFIVSVDKSLLEAISSNAVEWRALSVFRYKASDITSLDVTSFNEGVARPPVSLVAKGKEWVADQGSAPGTLNPVNIQSLVNTLSTLRPMQWTSETGPVVPAETVEFKTADGKSHKLFLGAPAADQTCLGMVEGEPGVFRIPAPDVSALRLPLVESAP